MANYGYLVESTGTSALQIRHDNAKKDAVLSACIAIGIVDSALACA